MNNELTELGAQVAEFFKIPRNRVRKCYLTKESRLLIPGKIQDLAYVLVQFKKQNPETRPIFEKAYSVFGYVGYYNFFQSWVDLAIIDLDYK